MNCPKCEEIMSDMGEMQISEAGVMFTKAYILNMFKCPKCNYVEFYYSRKSSV